MRRNYTLLSLLCILCGAISWFVFLKTLHLKTSLMVRAPIVTPTNMAPQENESVFQIKQETLFEEARQLERVRTVMQSLPSLRALLNTDANMPTLYLITPTYARATQKVDLTRMCYTLRLVPKVHWIVIEDSANKTELVARLLDYCRVPFRHLAERTPPELQRTICTKIDPTKGCPTNLLGKEAQMWTKARGVNQRNVGLRELRALAPTNGVLYFADDDNAYTLELFEEIRSTKKVSVWNVAYSGGLNYEGPKIDENGRVVGWHVGWRPDRPFPIDMAGFAINVNEITSRPDLEFSAKAERGFLESTFLRHIVSSLAELEPKGMDCKKCTLVWHIRTEMPDLKWNKAAVSRTALITTLTQTRDPTQKSRSDPTISK